MLTGQYQFKTIAIACREEACSEDKPVTAYFRFDTVAMENESIADFYPSGPAGGPLSANIRRYRDMEAALSALAAGEVKAAMAPVLSWGMGWLRALACTIRRHPALRCASGPLGVEINFRHRPFSCDLDDALRVALDDGGIAQIYSNHGLSFLPPER
ncbi:hypothetical protein So717_22140 [Roseobacter cerasinus]|uniref:Uncharacterized protein n=1 Tax=Roseobacter cerasinus TaxID=2602289 RepID=A0A640VTP6_9RHOB|nr:hypothetical protein [Roseobacter cerasinus]GFE50461.1 hypothetical protein So717_22140 [Roseobacter cerasinus]